MWRKNTSFKMSKLKFKPVGDRILLQRSVETEQVRDGVIIPDSARERPQQAKVIALGTGAKSKDGKILAFEVSVGDTVLIGTFAGSEVNLDEKKYTIVREEDILGVIG
jgi:chaperonin GroES